MENKMKKALIIFTSAMALFAFRAGTVYKTSSGTISFFSHTNIEDIDAVNKQVAAAVAPASGAMEFAVSINSFQFKKALMQKHFQENYLESSKFPKSTFAGKITNNAAVNYAKDGEYAATVAGKLTMHGVAQNVNITGKIIVKGNTLTLKSDFKIKLADYNIKIPAANAGSISEEISISVNCELKK